MKKGTIFMWLCCVFGLVSGVLASCAHSLDWGLLRGVGVGFVAVSLGIWLLESIPTLFKPPYSLKFKSSFSILVGWLLTKAVLAM